MSMGMCTLMVTVIVCDGFSCTLLAEECFIGEAKHCLSKGNTCLLATEAFKEPLQEGTENGDLNDSTVFCCQNS